MKTPVEVNGFESFGEIASPCPVAEEADRYQRFEPEDDIAYHLTAAFEDDRVASSREVVVLECPAIRRTDLDDGGSDGISQSRQGDAHE